MSVSIRVNNLRITRSEFEDRMSKYGITPVDWYNFAYTCDKEDLSKTIEYQMGYFYIQSLSSMVPVILLDPSEKDVLLDIAAAPGSKTTQAAMHMNNRGVIIANDVSYMRLKSLVSHIDRLGVMNTIVTNCDGRRFPGGITFTKILVDAPCSGLGSRKQSCSYSYNRISSLSHLQKSLIIRAFDLLYPGGEMVYSTCTTTIEENESVIKHLLVKRDNALLEKVSLGFDYEYGISDDTEINEKVARFECDEKFFVAKIRKERYYDI